MTGLLFKAATRSRPPPFAPPTERPDPMSTPPALPRHLIRLSDLRHRQPTAVRVDADAAARQAIAADLGIDAVRKLRLTGTLTPLGRRDWQLDAVLGASVVQPCIITLVPVTTRIDEPVIRRYLSELPPSGPGEVEMPQDDTAEPLSAEIDLAAVMIEALALALPPYPRAPGAMPGGKSGALIVDLTVTEPGAQPLTSAGVKPFAGLAALRDRLQTRDEPDGTG